MMFCAFLCTDWAMKYSKSLIEVSQFPFWLLMYPLTATTSSSKKYLRSSSRKCLSRYVSASVVTNQVVFMCLNPSSNA